ncbi:hypothetical protein CRUP_028974 [Coryphaenoides rupestris]|nr:hypothetical protein CRUP_028974 [Coryphaenoides rupestris]
MVHGGPCAPLAGVAAVRWSRLLLLLLALLLLPRAVVRADSAADGTSAAAAAAPPPPADDSVTPARRAEGVVRAVDRIYHGGGKVGYLVYLDGRRFQLDMERDRSVVSRHFDKQYALAMMGSEAAAAAANRECFYRGTVDSDPESLAVFNLCDGGLEGSFALKHARYTVTPFAGAGAGPARGEERDLRPRALRDTEAESALHWFTRESFSFESVPPARESCGTRERRPRSQRGEGNRDRRRHRVEHHDGGGGGDDARGRRRWWSRLAARPHATSTAAQDIKERRRRSVSRARHVELLLVADESMAKKYGKDLRHYLLTLASIASKLYGHASIENPVRLSVVKVTVLGGGKENQGLEVTKNAAATLRAFCKWQNQQNPLGDDQHQHHDAAILFTRQHLVGRGAAA